MRLLKKSLIMLIMKWSFSVKDSRGKKNKQKLERCETNEDFIYIPVLDSLQQLLFNDRIWKMFFRTKRVCNGDVFTIFRTGLCIKMTLVILKKKTCIIISNSSNVSLMFSWYEFKPKKSLSLSYFFFEQKCHPRIFFFFFFLSGYRILGLLV